MTETTRTPVYPSAQTYVEEFHTTYGAIIRTSPEVDIPEKELRISLMQEELKEYAEAWGQADIIEMADALGDFVYVTYGAAITYGVDIAPVLAELQKESFHLRHATMPATIPTHSLEDGNIALSILASSLHSYVKAARANNLPHITLALARCIDAAYGAAEVHGIQLDPVLQEIQLSNMSKLGEDGLPIRRADGKILKGPNFFVPNIQKVLEAQGLIIEPAV